MQNIRLGSTRKIGTIVAELRRLERLAKEVSQPELAHFIAAAGDLARLIVTRNAPPPEGTTRH